MVSLGDKMVEGTNALIYTQKKDCADEGRKVTAFLTKFDDRVEVHVPFTDISKVPTVTMTDLEPRGCTAMIDAIDFTINKTIDHLQKLDKRPGKVLVVVQTDGAENASKTSGEYVMKKITALKKLGWWEFSFIGANIDAIATGARYGFSRENCMQYDSRQATNCGPDSSTAINAMRGVSNWASRQATGDSSGFTHCERVSSVAPSSPQ